MFKQVGCWHSGHSLVSRWVQRISSFFYILQVVLVKPQAWLTTPALPLPPLKKEDLWMIFRSLPSASRLGQCFLAAAGCQVCQKMCFFGKKKLDVSQGRGQQPLTYFKSMGIYTALASKAMVLCTRRRGRPVGVGVWRSSVCCENILLQPGSGGYFYDESASGLWHAEPCLYWKNMGKMDRETNKKKHVMSTCWLPEVFSTWIDAKPMSQLCAEAEATRKTTARQVASC